MLQTKFQAPEPSSSGEEDGWMFELFIDAQPQSGEEDF